ncbi:helix-turn-helix domain-containing protein [Hyphococcus sp.]
MRSASNIAVSILTARERQCLLWAGAGKRDRDIASLLSISEKTASGYIESAVRKLNARNRTHAWRIAFEDTLSDTEIRDLDDEKRW